jgi:hypothetical protein
MPPETTCNPPTLGLAGNKKDAVRCLVISAILAPLPWLIMRGLRWMEVPPNWVFWLFLAVPPVIGLLYSVRAIKQNPQASLLALGVLLFVLNGLGLYRFGLKMFLLHAI